MKQNNCLNIGLKLFIGTVFLSSMAGAVTFKDLDQKLLVSYFDRNIVSAGLACTLPADKIALVFQDSAIPVSQADCFTIDKSETTNPKYMMKPSCSPDSLHPKLKLVANTICGAAVKAATAGSGGSQATGASANKGPGIQVQDVMQASLQTAAAAQTYKHAKKEQPESAQPASQASSSSPVSDVISETRNIRTMNQQQGPDSVIADQKNNKTAETPQLKEGDSVNVEGQQFGIGKNGNVTGSDGQPISYEKITNLCTSDLCKTALNNAPPSVKALAAKATAEPPKNPDENRDPGSIKAADLGANQAQNAQTQGSGAAQPIAASENCSAMSESIKSKYQTYSQARDKCTSDAATADTLCQVSRSPKAMLVQQLMTIGAPLIAKMDSASQTCTTTADLSKIAQIGMATASLMCSGIKMKCESSCAAADKILKQLSTETANVKQCATSEMAIGNAEVAGTFTAAHGAKLQATSQSSNSAALTIDSLIKQEEAAVKTVTVQCNKYAVDVVQMMTQATGLMMAAMQAKDCERKLSAGGAGGSGGAANAVSATVTMEQMCADSANAQMLVCKCKADPNTVGCPGAVVKNKDGNGPVIKGGGSGSQLAGINNFGQKSGLSPAAKSALGLNSDSELSSADSKNNLAGSSSFSSAAGNSGVGTENSGGVGSAHSKAASDLATDDKSKSKLNFGGFGSFGGSIGGLFGGSKKSGDSAKFSKDQQVAAAKRQIANEQIRSEVSSASGKSNWDKVRSRYVESNSSFLGQ
jgi:hypothetical protein